MGDVKQDNADKKWTWYYSILGPYVLDGLPETEPAVRYLSIPITRGDRHNVGEFAIYVVTPGTVSFGISFGVPKLMDGEELGHIYPSGMFDAKPASWDTPFMPRMAFLVPKGWDGTPNGCRTALKKLAFSAIGLVERVEFYIYWLRTCYQDIVLPPTW